MGYEPTTWHGGDVLSAEAMNKIENGIANAGSGALEVEVIGDGGILTLNKTWQEIHDAFPNVYIYFDLGGAVQKISIYGIQYARYEYEVMIGEDFFITDSPNGYPVLENSDGDETITD